MTGYCFLVIRGALRQGILLGSLVGVLSFGGSISGGLIGLDLIACRSNRFRMEIVPRLASGQRF